VTAITGKMGPNARRASMRTSAWGREERSAESLVPMIATVTL
jgi:hypothetical protein